MWLAPRTVQLSDPSGDSLERMVWGQGDPLGSAHDHGGGECEISPSRAMMEKAPACRPCPRSQRTPDFHKPECKDLAAEDLQSHQAPRQPHCPAKKGPAPPDTLPCCLAPAGCPWLAHPEVSDRGREQGQGGRRKDFQGCSHLEPRQESPAPSAANSPTSSCN